MDPYKASRENSAFEISAQLALDEGGDWVIALSGAGEKRLELLAYDLVQDRVLGLSASIGLPVAIQRLASAKRCVASWPTQSISSVS
jgi:hypothetical protein